MYGIGPGGRGRAKDGLGVEIAVGHRSGPDAYGLVGMAHEGKPGVSLGVDGHAANAQGAAGAGHPGADFAAVGDEDLLNHAWSPRQWRKVPQLVVPTKSS